MTGTAFVLSGGGSHGAVQVGMARALFEAGIAPDALYGTSIGAVNAAALAQGFNKKSIDALAEKWTRSALAPPLRPSIADVVAALAGRSPSLFSVEGIRGRLAAGLSYAAIEDAPIPLRIVATNLLTGEERLFESGAVADALMASCAVPGFFPPVDIDGSLYVDGLLYGAPVHQAIENGHSEIFLLLTSPPVTMSEVPKNWWSITRRAATVIMSRQLTDSARQRCTTARVYTLPAVPILRKTSRRRFDSGPALMSESFEVTSQWLRATEELRCHG
ncbi:patatin-like phospholipase family protein [Nocardia suismassiliense]|uniref:patatin-like phospholipase family protein n=1 Tax=Nocardia suismassiliense TaxID=2077092 RepID=UPI000D1E5B6D|nr:patatin-like phospholipase family protein [Nocardia suismassiliense]